MTNPFNLFLSLSLCIVCLSESDGSDDELTECSSDTKTFMSESDQRRDSGNAENHWLKHTHPHNLTHKVHLSDFFLPCLGKHTGPTALAQFGWTALCGQKSLY